VPATDPEGDALGWAVTEPPAWVPLLPDHHELPFSIAAPACAHAPTLMVKDACFNLLRFPRARNLKRGRVSAGAVL